MQHKHSESLKSRRQLLANKRKIINDPVHGFIHLQYDLIYDLLEHPYFQRLRRIQQLGLSAFVYPGANHTRFAHALGATHLMQQAIEVLRSKGQEISEAEAESVCAAILLHDIGHGPYSHALEHTLVTKVHHEAVSLAYMQAINKEMNGRLDLAIAIFENKYPRKFLNQLVSSQLDMDRLDYLSRDSFFTGVHEGVIGYDRIIKMLDVAEDEIVVEEKGIYSIEKFIISRRLMYWQVYLHKTVLCAETMMVKVLERAKSLALNGVEINASKNLDVFLQKDWSLEDFTQGDLLQKFAMLDDSDILYSLKNWSNHSDHVLYYLANGILNRKLLKIEFQKTAIAPEILLANIHKYMELTKWDLESISYLVFEDSTSNKAYNSGNDSIKILYKNGSKVDIAEASDNLNIKGLTDPVIKYFMCYPKYLPNQKI